ncbi:UPF0149 family protein [Wenzhouxiangella sp. EGI_FJ10409]|uniref:UPF0149 family protein n=1 Tax=Wenzhouxiangella sp. EGI_FJ10409 TaxID=3243767 RepID=UPI0035DCDB15
MFDNAKRLEYDPRSGPDRSAWLAAPEAERTLAVRRWLKHNDMPFPCCAPRSADEWREVEDQLASGLPPETARLMARLREAGIDRVVALWAMAEAVGSRQYDELGREARRSGRPEIFDIERLFDQADTAILPAAFEVSAGGFGPSHQTVIDYYHRHHDPEGAMPFAEAAGFCFGCAASPKFIRNHTLYEHMYGNRVADSAPFYLPVADAYRELFRFVSDAVFEQDDPIPPAVRPPAEPEACFDLAFAGWCRGFLATQPVVAPGWESHLSGHPDLHAEYLETIATLSFFAGRDQARAILRERGNGDDLAEAARRMHAGLADAIRRLFRLAHPIMEREDGTD